MCWMRWDGCLASTSICVFPWNNSPVIICGLQPCMWAWFSVSKRTSCCHHFFWLTAWNQLIKVWINSSNLHFYSCIMNTYRRQQPTPVSCLILMVVSQALPAAGTSTHPLCCYGCFSVLGPQLENVFSFLDHLASSPSGLSRSLEQSPSCPL